MKKKPTNQNSSGYVTVQTKGAGFEVLSSWTKFSPRTKPFSRREKQSIVDRFLRGRSMTYLSEVFQVHLDVIEDIVREEMVR